MQILDTFDTQTTWTVYNGSGYNITGGKLAFVNSSSSHGALLSPYEFSGRQTIEFDIRLASDYAGRQHGGCWLYDSTKNNWFRFYFLDNQIGTLKNLNATPINTAFTEQIDVATSPTFNSGNIFKMRLEIADKTVSSYVDGKLINSRDVGFLPVGFALFAYGCAIEVDNLFIAQQTYQVSGKSLQDDGVASRFVLINDWQTGAFIKTITPRSNGDWEYVAPNTNKLIISHIGAEGFAPKIDAPIAPVATPL